MSAEPLQWEPYHRSTGWAALSGVGMYVVVHVVHNADEQEWICEWREKLWLIGVPIYRGDSPDEAKAAAAAHRAATARAAAWERYMAENDPPSNGEAL